MLEPGHKDVTEPVHPEREMLASILFVSHAARAVLEEEVLREFRPLALSSIRVDVLRLLSRRGPQPVHQLAHFIGATKAAASQHVQVLEGNGFVRRLENRADRRVVSVAITADGERILRQADALQQEAVRRALRELPERDHLVPKLQGIARALMKSSRTQGESCLRCCAFEPGRCIRTDAGWACRFNRSAESEKKRGCR